MKKQVTPSNTQAAKQAGSFEADSLLQVIRKGFFLIGLSWKQLKVGPFVSDFFSVLGSIGFVSVPAILVGLLFLILPQGRDALLIIIEQMMTPEPNWWPFFGLIAGVVLWSMASELAIRYAISISDNSGINLSDERVLWRKTVQKLLAGSFLLWPILLVITAFLIILFSADYPELRQRLLYTGVVILTMVALLLGLSYLYFQKFQPAEKKDPKRTLLGHRSLPPAEQKLIFKLYGIYNDYVFRLPKPTNFVKAYRKGLQALVNNFKQDPQNDPNELPKNPGVINKGNLVPENFELRNRNKIKDSAGVLKWVYRMPPFKVYPSFHKQVYIMALSALALLIVISCIPAEWSIYGCIGAPGLVCIAFACYTGLYAGLLFIDKVVIPWSPVGIRQFLFFFVLLISLINEDHPVRADGKSEDRPAMRAHFEQWFAAYKQDVDRRLGHSLTKYPVVFVCAEGGAFRTGAFTALFLTEMEAELLKPGHKVDFRHSIFAMSGVSGGSVGLGFYNAAAYRSNIPFRDTVTVSRTKAFFKHDSLSPLIGKMFFGEFLNLFYWKQVTLFDRAAALEKSWESAYRKFVDGGRNSYQDPFVLPNKGRPQPVLVINTAEVETGRQCWVSGAVLETPFLAKERDLLAAKVGKTFYSTAINFSSRFPLFSPGAEIDYPNGHRLHYLDGGYVENTGTGTMMEILNELRSSNAYQLVKPVVISLRFGEESTDIEDIKFANELAEIVQGVYNTRVGRTEFAAASLEQCINAEDGIFIKVALSPKEKKIPMNWVLSEQSMRRIQDDIHKKFSSDSTVLKKFFGKGVTYLPLQP